MKPLTDDQIRAALLAEQRSLTTLAASLVDPALATDIVHDAFAEVLAGSTRPNSVRSFVSCIVRRRASNALRSVSRRTRRECAAAQPELLPSAADMAERRELIKKIGDAVEHLDEPYRTTIWMRFFDDLMPAEIAERLGVSVNTVNTRLQRGIRRLRERLDTEFGSRSSWLVQLLPIAGGGKGSGGAILSPWVKKLAVLCLSLALITTVAVIVSDKAPNNDTSSATISGAVAATPATRNMSDEVLEAPATSTSSSVAQARRSVAPGAHLAPSGTSSEIPSTQDVLVVELRDAHGAIRDLPARVIYHGSENSDHQRFDAGIAWFEWAPSRDSLSILFDDGDLIRCNDISPRVQGNRRIVAIGIDRVRQPLRFALPSSMCGYEGGRPAIVTPTGFQSCSPWDEQDFFSEYSPSPFAWFVADSRVLVMNSPNTGWRSVWYVLPDGRIARADNPGGRVFPIEMLEHPAITLQDLDLRREWKQLGSPANTRFTFELELKDDYTASHTVTIAEFTAERAAQSFPVWRMNRPRGHLVRCRYRVLATDHCGEVELHAHH